MKSILFVQSQAPHGSVNAQEGLDAILMGSAFARCAVLFTNEGVLQVRSGQDTTSLGAKDFARTYGALKDYGVTDVYCSQQALDRLGLSREDLVIDVTPLDGTSMRELIESHDVVLNF